MIVARCKDCNYVARYNSKYYSVAELQRHLRVESTAKEDGLCNHVLNFSEGDENN
ncbi:MAG: hypothetical protein OER82_02980 [Nitrosopumilus sp.]|nr:hypothetical protein [Nitrosopumilus sp.]